MNQKGYIEELNIPASLIYLKEIPHNYKAYNVDKDNKYYKSIDGVLFSKDGTILLKYPVATNKKSYIVPKGVKIIGNSAFINSGLEEVILPEGLEQIGYGAFYSVPLKTIEFPDSLKNISSYAFARNYRNLFSLSKVGLGLQTTKITLPKNLELVDADRDLYKIA